MECIHEFIVKHDNVFLLFGILRHHLDMIESYFRAVAILAEDIWVSCSRCIGAIGIHAVVIAQMKARSAMITAFHPGVSGLEEIRCIA